MSFTDPVADFLTSPVVATGVATPGLVGYAAPRRMLPGRDVPWRGRHSVESAASAASTACRARWVLVEPKVEEASIIAGIHAFVAVAAQHRRPVGSSEPQRRSVRNRR